MFLADKLRPFVGRLVEDARRGNARAQRVIDLYRLYLACPRDPAAPNLCEAAFDEWLSGHRRSRKMEARK
jgi:hypothetical protein